MDRSRVALGEWGEAKVARHYEAAGYEVLDRNWRVRGGEIDLVLARGDEVVFCEVKTRTSSRFGHASEAVGHRKQQLLDVLCLCPGANLVQRCRGRHRQEDQDRVEHHPNEADEAPS